MTKIKPKRAIVANLSIVGFYAVAGLLAYAVYKGNTDWGGWWSVAGCAAIGTYILYKSLRGEANT